jgi:hypothetical protein
MANPNESLIAKRPSSVEKLSALLIFFHTQAILPSHETRVGLPNSILLPLWTAEEKNGLSRPEVDVVVSRMAAVSAPLSP